MKTDAPVRRQREDDRVKCEREDRSEQIGVSETFSAGVGMR